MHLLVNISAHGLGHLSQTAPVIEAILALLPRLQLTVRSGLPRQQLERRIASGFDHVPEARDFGFVMHNAVDIDLAASAKAYRKLHDNWREQVALEVDWLKTHGVDAVLSNIAYLPLAAAGRAGIPCAGLCSLNWADLFLHYFAADSWAAKIHEQMLSAYRAADCFLRVTPGLPMSDLSRRHDIGPIARPGKANRPVLARRLGIVADSRWILFAMGGMAFRVPVESWPIVPGLHWLVPAGWRIRRADVHAFDGTDIAFADLLASVDAVITKPGYGIFAEAACCGTPVLYVQRDDWPETPYLSAWLAGHARCRELSRSRLMNGEFIDDLRQLWQEPAPALPSASGVEEAVGLLTTVLGLR